MASHSYKTILKKIILKLGFGFKKDRIEACLGEEIPLQLDEKLFEGNVKTNKTKNRKNSFARWFKEDGSEITDSKTIQDDNGTTYTKTDQASYLMHQIENTKDNPNYSAVYECMVHERGGNAQFIWGKRKTQNWTAYLNRDDNSFNISGTDLKNPSNRGDFLSMLPNGVILGRNQPKASGRLIKSTGRFPVKTWIQLGQMSEFQKFRDEDGFNKSSNNFYPGDGNQSGAYYTFPYAGVWAVQFQYILDQGTAKNGTRVLTRITWGKPGSYKSLRITTQMAWKYQQFGDCKLLPFEKGDTCFIEVNVDDDDERINPFIYAEDNIRNIDNYLGFFLVIG